MRLKVNSAWDELGVKKHFLVSQKDRLNFYYIGGCVQ